MAELNTHGQLLSTKEDLIIYAWLVHVIHSQFIQKQKFIQRSIKFNDEVYVPTCIDIIHLSEIENCYLCVRL